MRANEKPLPAASSFRRALTATFCAAAAGIALPAQVTFDDAVHITNRIGFGGNPADRAAVINNYTAWLNQQLNPTTIADPAVDALYAPGTYPSYTIELLQTEQFVRAIASERRLQEVMTYFWEQHFSTNYFRIQERLVLKGLTLPVNAPFQATRLEAQNNYLYRSQALGSFRTLLYLTTISPAMMLYLDNDTNQGCQGNENYAREFLELYSMGPVNESTGATNYSQLDIAAAARCFSGWNVILPSHPNAVTTFNGNHCVGVQTLFAAPNTVTINHVGNGSNQMFDLVAAVSGLDPTKDFICRKLMRYFLSDAGGSAALLASMKAAWGPAGDIRAVLTVLLQSPEFTGPTHRWKRASTPFERVAWWQRVWNTVLVRTDNGQVDLTKANVMREVASNLGERLFMHPTPDGYQFRSDEQLSAAVVVTSWDYAAKLRTALDPLPVAPTNFYPAHPTVVMALFLSPNTVPSTVAQLILTNLYGSAHTAVDRLQVANAVQFDHTGALQPPLDPVNAPLDYATRCAIGAATAGAMIRAQLK